MRSTMSIMETNMSRYCSSSSFWHNMLCPSARANKNRAFHQYEIFLKRMYMLSFSGFALTHQAKHILKGLRKKYRSNAKTFYAPSSLSYQQQQVTSSLNSLDDSSLKVSDEECSCSFLYLYFSISSFIFSSRSSVFASFFSLSSDFFSSEED